MIRQRTLRNAIAATGYGLHSGEPVSLRLAPAPIGTGIRFRRTDVTPAVEIPAAPDQVIECELSATLGRDGYSVTMVEHLMAALAGFGVDNAIIEVNAAELPIMDGSAGPLVFLIQSAGIAEQEAAKQYLRIRRPLVVEDDGQSCAFHPYHGFKLQCAVDFQHAGLRRQPSRVTIDLSANGFAKQVSRARRYCSLASPGACPDAGAPRGASVDNSILIDEQGIVNDGALRYEDELVRHAVLDAIGDLYLLGHSLVGEYRSEAASRRLNLQAVRALLAEPEAWEIVSFDDPASAPISYHSGPTAIAA